MFLKIVTLDRVITHFLDRIVFSSESASSSDHLKSRLITYTLAQVAMIQLHRRIAGQDTRSGHKCLEAANAAVRAIEHIPNISQWGYIDSIMSVRFFGHISVSCVLTHFGSYIASMGSHMPGVNLWNQNLPSIQLPAVRLSTCNGDIHSIDHYHVDAGSKLPSHG